MKAVLQHDVLVVLGTSCEAACLVVFAVFSTRLLFVVLSGFHCLSSSVRKEVERERREFQIEKTEKLILESL